MIINSLYFCIYNLFEIITAGLNCVPFSRVLQNIIELKPKSKYIFAVDDSKNTLEDIVKVALLKTQMQQYIKKMVNRFVVKYFCKVFSTLFSHS